MRPAIKAALDDDEIGGQDIAPSRLPAVASTGCSRTSSRSQLGQQLSAGSGRDKNEPTGPGLHGTNIDSVSYGDTTLQPGASNQLTYAADSTFSVKFTNGGENDEFDVKVTVKIEGGSGDPITLSDTIDQIAPEGQRHRQPRPREAAAARRRGDHHRAASRRCPGEEKTDNNQAEYQAIFDEG